MNTFKTVGGAAAVALLLAFAGTSNAAEELVVTTNTMTKAKMAEFALDVMTEGSAAAIQFNIALPKGVKASQVDLSKCMADLPKTHQGECSVARGQIVGIAYNDEGVTLPAGMVSIGKIQIAGSPHRGADLKVLNFVVSTYDAKELPTTSTIR